MKLRRLWAITVARSLEFLRDRSAMSWNILVPVIMVAGIGFVFSGPGQPLFKVAVMAPAQAQLNGKLHPFLDTPHIQFYAEDDLDGTVDRIIMSGDGNDSSGFGEPTVMRKVAEAMGVPADAIVEDPQGVDTYSSCVNARDTFGATSVIMVSQAFHVPRAVWVCDRIGLRAQGAYPPQRMTKSTVVGHAREVPADAKAMIDVWRGRVPAGRRSR